MVVLALNLFRIMETRSMQYAKKIFRKWKCIVTGILVTTILVISVTIQTHKRAREKIVLGVFKRPHDLSTIQAMSSNTPMVSRRKHVVESYIDSVHSKDILDGINSWHHIQRNSLRTPQSRSQTPRTSLTSQNGIPAKEINLFSTKVDNTKVNSPNETTVADSLEEVAVGDQSNEAMPVSMVSLSKIGITDVRGTILVKSKDGENRIFRDDPQSTEDSYEKEIDLKFGMDKFVLGEIKMAIGMDTRTNHPKRTPKPTTVHFTPMLEGRTRSRVDLLNQQIQTTKRDLPSTTTASGSTRPPGSMSSYLENPSFVSYGSDVAFMKPTIVKTINNLWQIVLNSTYQIYLFSAFYDDRPALDLPAVRVISVAEIGVKTVFCLLWFSQKTKTLIIAADIIVIGPRIGIPGSGKYESYIFSCNLPKSSDIPSQVSILTTTLFQPSNLLNVQVPEKPEQPMEFGHCMSVIYWKHDPYKLVEWLELHRLWGVSEINVYANNLDFGATEIFRHYARDGLVKFYQAPNILDNNEEGTILLNMSPVINDCLYRNMYRYKKIICTDVDEMIVPRRHDNYTAMLKSIDEKQPRSHPARSYLFKNVYFFKDFGPTVKQPWFLLTQCYLSHVHHSLAGYSSKSITDPQACIGLQNHLCWKRVAKYDSHQWNLDVDASQGLNHHYKRCHFDDYLERQDICATILKHHLVDTNMLRFQSKLAKVTFSELVQLGLV